MVKGSKKTPLGIVEPNPPRAPKSNPPLVHFNRGVWVRGYHETTLHRVNFERNIRCFYALCGEELYYPVAPDGKEKRCTKCQRIDPAKVPKYVDLQVIFCEVCTKDIPQDRIVIAASRGEKAKYCSTTCRSTAAKRRQRES